jgi:hypothetical protein
LNGRGRRGRRGLGGTLDLFLKLIERPVLELGVLAAHGRPRIQDSKFKIQQAGQMVLFRRPSIVS